MSTTRERPVPKTVRIAPHTYYFTNQEDILKQAELVGQCDNEMGIIRYRTEEISRSQLMETLVHECLHGIFFNAGLKFPSDEDEENIINKLAPRILSFVLDNPRFFEWLYS